MSATPIPRTLEMAVTGIRDMSTIQTPPEERHPVLTFVGAYDEKQIAAAIRREMLREGQVFYVHNRVESIERAAARLRELVPEARIAVAHGQMGEHQLEEVMLGFWEKDFDVLVSHDDRRDRPGHPQRQHADPGAGRRVRAVAAAPAARAGRARPRACLRLLPVPAGEAAVRAGPRPAVHDRRSTPTSASGHGRGDEGPGDPRRRQHPRRASSPATSTASASTCTSAWWARRCTSSRATQGRARRPTSRSSCRWTPTCRTTGSPPSGCGCRRTPRLAEAQDEAALAEVRRRAHRPVRPDCRRRSRTLFGVARAAAAGPQGGRQRDRGRRGTTSGWLRSNSRSHARCA